MQQIKYAIRNKHMSYLAKIEALFKQNPKLFWSYHKAFPHQHSVLNPIICHNNRIAKTSREKAELLNFYFCSVFRTARSISAPTDLLCDITISEEEVAITSQN